MPPIGAILKGAQSTIGIFGSLAGGVFDAIGAGKRIKEAKAQATQGRAAGLQRKGLFQDTYGDLESMLAGQATYKGDTSAYGRVESEAKRQQMMAQNVNPADQIYREQARQGTSNYIEQASRGARSGVDLMAIAGIGAGMEGQQMMGLNAQSANQRMTTLDRANQSLIGALSNTAGATARERAMEFDSKLAKSQAQIGLAKEKGLGIMDIEYQNLQEDFARRAALEDAKASQWSGIGDAFRSIGGGVVKDNMLKSKGQYLGID